MNNLNESITFLLTFFKLWNFTMCQEVARFIRIQASTDYLAEVSIFAVTSRIECSAQCLVRMDHNNYTAFSIDENLGTCTCGRKHFAPVQDTGSKAKLHVIASCPKIKTGQFCLPRIVHAMITIRTGCMPKNPYL